MRPAIMLRENLRSGRLTIGALVTDHLWLGLVESAMEAGLDYLIVDAEHTDHGGTRIAEFCLVGRLAKFPILLRPPRTDTDSIRIAMDLGPCGLVLPAVESTEQLDHVRDGIYLPPRGRRRPGGWSNRWVKQFDYETFRGEVEDHLIVIPQVETRAGLRCADEIAAHPITTALGVGPFDLSADLGVCWKPAHRDFKDALARLRQAAAAAHKSFWSIGDPTELARAGDRFICAGDPVALMQCALAAMVADVRGSSAGAARPPVRHSRAVGDNGFKRARAEPAARG